MRCKFQNVTIYLDDLLNIDNKYLESLISQIYPSEFQLNTS